MCECALLSTLQFQYYSEILVHAILNIKYSELFYQHFCGRSFCLGLEISSWLSFQGDELSCFFSTSSF